MPIFNINYSDVNFDGIEQFCSNLNLSEGNIDSNPQFNEDFTLQPNSPCIDAGDPASDLDPDGTIADLGAYYYHQEPVSYGCTDLTAINYDPDATSNDGSCYHDVLTDIDGENPREKHWGDMWHHAVSKMVIAARANGLRPIDGPFGDFNDPDGYIAQANRSATLGCEGKWAIHPSQIELANKVMSPSDKEINQAKRILEAMEQAKKDGKGAVSLDGRLIDIASIRQAEVLVQKAKLIEGK